VGLGGIAASDVGEDLLDDGGVLPALAFWIALPPASMQSNAGDDPHSTATVLAGFVGHIPVPDRFAAVGDGANRLSYRFVDIDPKHALEALCPGRCLTSLGLGLF
jgi:hypothetical protein